MKVTRNTPSQLILDDTPWLIAIMLIVFIFAFVGPAVGMMMDGVWEAFFFGLFGGGLGFTAFAVFVRRVQVILNKADSTVTIRKRSVFSYKQVVHDLRYLGGAKLERTRNNDGNTLYRPTLVLTGGMSEGDHPIIESYTNTSGPKRLVDAVNAWLDENRPDDTVADNRTM